MKEMGLSAPAGVLLANLKPWESIDWPAEQQRWIHRSWGQYFARMRKNSVAEQYFDKCIKEHEGIDHKALYLRSKFQRSVALTEFALEDSLKAVDAKAAWNANISMELADALYDLNRFEDNKSLLHDNVRRHAGTALRGFENRLRVVDENLKDCTGYSMANFFMENSTQLPGFYEYKQQQQRKADKRPLWKILKEQKQCDVQSIIDRKEVILSPLEIERRRRKTKIYYQNYLGRNWTDFIFLKTLRRNPNCLLDNNFGSSPARTEHLESSFKRLKTFTRMLQARSPMYNEYYQRSPRMEFCMREANLFRIQYQTRRNMFSILRTIQVLRKKKDIKRLRKFVEDVMGNYVVIKTNRLMPWKTEFMNEVYNNLALSLCEQYRLPSTRVTPYDKSAMCQLLNIPIAKPLEHTEFIFGDRSTYSTYAGPERQTTDRLADQNYIDYLEKRLVFARLPIERSYLLHELADRHMLKNHFIQSLSYAQKSVDEARGCNSRIWEFLSTMLMAKSHAVLHKYERQTEVLNSAYALATELKSPPLCTFIELCRMLNKDYLTLRKMSQLVTNKRLRTKISNRSSFFTSPNFSPNFSEMKKNENDLLVS
ncbi:LOW QUALITY PROTEIN: uncharacterized protein LOC108098116 [Drosophila ficusphila]|uniref:LOW QUALITY PROTEIN: uncharacterized protein LOC108098116 n=1 Tax=Drosophila ficusphila TaxID=30025 RepID=UPI0007E8727C|nr:LOW QUALITY PROTEIN: uncharacterized protein LOC108098116 [Drosophila ficusphila]